jgi:hypothetical protein
MMKRVDAFLIVACVALLIPAWLLFPGHIPEVKWFEPDPDPEEAKLAEWRASRSRFLYVLDNTLHRLADGRVSLLQAAEDLLQYSEEHHPVYANAIYFRERATTRLQCVALNLIRHFRMEMDDGNPHARPLDLLPRLEMEFRLAFGDFSLFEGALING